MSSFGVKMPSITTAIPGPASVAAMDVISETECPAITARRARRAATMGVASDDPIVWDQALGANVTDVDGNRFVDLTSGFGVALVGHSHPRVVAAVQKQSARLLHASGDAWPDITRATLLKKLLNITPEGLDLAILGLSGSDAVEGAVKSACLATGRTKVLAFDGAYHGLQLGALPLQGYKPAFREPFEGLLRQGLVTHLPFGSDPQLIEETVRRESIGLVIVEPVLGRGGMVPAPQGWLAGLKAAAHSAGALIGFDEIQTGMGRTGDWFACTADGVTPDLLMVGKALGGGLPISATIGTKAVMEAWGASKGEALHTQTFLGHPLGSAAAIAVLDLIKEENLLARVQTLSTILTNALVEAGFTVWGRGLMLGVGLNATSPPLAVSRELLQLGYLTLPAGKGLGLTPPAVLSEEQVAGFVRALRITTDRCA